VRTNGTPCSILHPRGEPEMEANNLYPITRQAIVSIGGRITLRLGAKLRGSMDLRHSLRADAFALSTKVRISECSVYNPASRCLKRSGCCRRPAIGRGMDGSGRPYAFQSDRCSSFTGDITVCQRRDVTAGNGDGESERDWSCLDSGLRLGAC
jgi:hypothetical protein